MKLSTKANTLLGLGAACASANLFKRPLGLPDWIAFTLVGCGLFLVLCAVRLARRVRKNRDPSLPPPVPFLKRKSRLALLIIPFVVGGAYGVYDFAQESQTATIDHELKVALDASRSLPTGIDRGDDFVARLRQIKTGWAPREVKEALADYISALQAALDALKAGKDPNSDDPNLARAQQRLAAVIKKNWP